MIALIHQFTLPCRPFSFFFLLHFNHSRGSRVRSHVVLIWISLVTYSVAYLFTCVLFIGILSFGKCSIDLKKQNKQTKTFHYWLNPFQRPRYHGDASNESCSGENNPSKTPLCSVFGGPPLPWTTPTRQKRATCITRNPITLQSSLQEVKEMALGFSS